jgi:DNA-binding Lrp family transcriptional regulator
MQTIEIAEKLNTTAKTISNRIKKLIKQNVIQGFKILIDISKIAYICYKLDITLTNYKKKNQIVNYLKRNRYVGSLGKSAGYCDLELDLVIENEEQLHNIMEEIIVKFPNTIKNYDYFFQSEVHKMQFIPQE